MIAVLKLYSDKEGELNRFLSSFYNVNLDLEKKLNWDKEYKNPVELAEIIGAHVDNWGDFGVHMWISLDKDIFVYVTDRNGDELIRYLYERFPY